MSKPIRVLVLEDRIADAEINIRELRRAGFDPQWKRVETEADFLAELGTSPDLILADYSLPHFDGLRAVKLLRDSGLDIPFILISGTIGEEAAVEAIKHGATDYLLKDRIARLGSAVERALEEKRLGVERRKADELIRLQSSALAAAANGVMITDRAGRILWINPAFTRMTGFTAEEAIGNTPRILKSNVHDAAFYRDFWNTLLLGQVWRGEFINRHKNGSLIYDEHIVTPVRSETGQITHFIGILNDVSERNQAQKELLASERRYRRLFESAKDGILILNAKTGEIVDVNPFLMELLDYSRADFLGKQLWEIGCLKDIVANQAAFQKLQEEKYIRYENLPLVTKGGHSIWVEFVSNAYDANGQQVIQCNIRDVTVRKQAEQELQWKTAFLEAQVNSSIDGILVVDVKGKKQLQNQRMNDLWKIPQHIVEDSDDEKQRRWVAETTKNPGQFLERVYYLNSHPNEISRDEMELKDGTILDRYSSPVVGKDGTYYGRIWTFRDITERKRGEKALFASEALFRGTLENLKLIAMSLDKKGTVTFCNDYLLQLTNWEREEIISANWFEKFVPESELITKLFYDTIESGEVPSHYDNPIKTRTGALRDVRWNNTLIRDSAGNIIGLSCIGEDVTERKHAEQALRDSEERFRQLAENIDEVFWIVNPADLQILYVSPAFERIWGCPCENLFKSRQVWLDTIHPEDRDHVRLAAMTKQSRGDYDETYRIVRPDGSVRWIHDRAFPIRNAAGEVFRVVGTASDVTANRDLEVQFRQSQKMEAFGLLAGGIAHDFNNLMSVVMGYSDIWLMKLPRDAPIRGPLKAIRNAGERASDLTKQLLAFSRKTVLEPKVLDLNAVVRETEKMLQRLIGEDVQLTSILNPAIPQIKIDPGQIGQVLMNLAVNARDAMPRGGSLTIETRMVNLDAAYVLLHPDAQPGRQVMLSVGDTGIGMAPETVVHIFEPFFTTKGVGKGTGLGLAVVHGVVTQSGGSIEVESKVGVGTTFKLYFPATLEALDKEGKADDISIHAGVETILVVEDEESLRDIVAESLRSLGYHVLTADAGLEALEIVRGNPGTIDLMITDVVMPGMSGRELADTLRPELPKLKVLYMSGYTDDSVLRNGVNQEKVAFLQKPFTPFDLLKKVREELDKY